MRYVTSWVLGVVLVVASCAGSDDEQTGAADGTAVVSTAVDDGDRSADVREDGDGADDADAGGVGFVPWGPDDPPVPGRYFNLHADSPDALDCDSVESESPPDDPFWELVVAVCRAITEEQDWPAPTEVPPSPPVENGFQACMDAELTAMLQAVMAWRAAHPDERPAVEFPRSGTESPCRSQIFDVRVEVVDGGIELGLATADPDPDRVELKIDGTVVSPDPDRPPPDDLGSGLTGIVYFLPGPFEAHTATLELTNAYGTSTAQVELPAVGGEQTTDAESPSDTSTDATQPDVADSEPNP